VDSISATESAKIDTADAETPPYSGSTTPSRPSVDASLGSLSRMSRPFFGFSEFLRSRHTPSQQPSIRVVPEVPEGSQENEQTSSAAEVISPAEENASPPDCDVEVEDDEDRHTIRGTSTSGGADGEARKTQNGMVAPPTPAEDEEKLANGRGVSPRVSEILT